MKIQPTHDKRTNALLLYPQVPDTFWSFKYILKFLRRKAAHPPLGLLTVASLMPSDWDIRLVDTNVTQLTDEDLNWADMVFISAMIVQKSSTRKLIDRCHSFDKKIIGGGPLFHSETDEFCDVDHLILGESEVTLQLFLNDLASGDTRHIYDSEEKPDLARTPLPRWDLISFKNYASMSIQYSRGCPFNCEFCDVVKLNGRRPRTKTPEQMQREFQALFDHGWKGRLFVVDDNFIGNTVKVKEVLKALIKWQKEHHYPFTLYTEASVNLANDDELMTLMSTAGFDCVFLGLETPDEESLKECGKHQNCGKDLVGMIQTIQKHGIEVMGGFILGFDNDAHSIFERQFEFISKSGVMKAMVGLLQALPGTKLYDRLKVEGRLLLNGSGDNCDGSTNFRTRMDPKILREGYQRLLNHLYSPKEYYARATQFLKQYKPARRKRIDFGEFMAFLRSILYLGILERGRSKFYYWKFLITAFLFHRKAFGEAISTAIFGYHFRKLFVKKTGR